MASRPSRRPRHIGHTKTYRGKIVWVETKRGEVFTDRFLEKTPGNRIKFASGRVLGPGEIKQLIVSPTIRKKKRTKPT